MCMQFLRILLVINILSITHSSFAVYKTHSQILGELGAIYNGLGNMPAPLFNESLKKSRVLIEMIPKVPADFVSVQDFLQRAEPFFLIQSYVDRNFSDIDDLGLQLAIRDATRYYGALLRQINRKEMGIYGDAY